MTQLEWKDAEGNNLAMLAARGGHMAILKAVMAEIQHTGVRKRWRHNVYLGEQLRNRPLGYWCCFRRCWSSCMQSVVGFSPCKKFMRSSLPGRFWRGSRHYLALRYNCNLAASVN